MNKIARKDPTFKRLERSVPREELIDLLQVSADERVVKLVECLLSSNPDMMKRSLASIAGVCRLTQADLIRELSRARVQEGVLRMSKHIPKVLEDTAIDAKSRSEVCENCLGVGEISNPRKNDKSPNDFVDCPKCSGKGKIRKAGNTEARKLVFEAAGLTNKKGPGVNVNVNTPTEMPTVEHDMESIDRILEVKVGT